MRRLNTLVLALLLASTAAARVSAQRTVSPDAIQAAQAVAGSAKVAGARIAGDSLFIEVDDPPLSLRALEDGYWRFGGREGYPKEVVRDVAAVIRAGLPSSSSVKEVLVRLYGADGTTVTYFYRAADLRRPVGADGSLSVTRG